MFGMFTEVLIDCTQLLKIYSNISVNPTSPMYVTGLYLHYKIVTKTKIPFHLVMLLCILGQR